MQWQQLQESLIAVYKFFTPDYLEDFEEDFEDDFDDDFFSDDDEV